MKNGFFVGQSALAVCQTIVSVHPEIVRVRLISHAVSVNWRQTHLSPDEQLGDLEGSFLHSEPTGEHVYEKEAFSRITENTLPGLPRHHVWSFSSRVQCADGQDRHIPMMNFHPEPMVTLADLKKALLHIVGQKEGALLQSGRYYHYYGHFLLTQEAWQQFLGAFLMPCVLVSPRYIGHRLQAGYCTLRLTSDDLYKPQVPAVLEVL